MLYESSYSGQFFMLFDGMKRLLGVGDAFPKAIKAPKGKHTLLLQVRAESVSALEGMVDMPVMLERVLKQSISLTSYSSQTSAARGENGGKTFSLHHGDTAVIFFKEPSFDQLPKAASPGDLLLGHVTYLKRPSGQIGLSSEPGKGFKITYSVADTKPPTAPAAPSKASKETETESALEESAEDSQKAAMESLATAVRDAKVKFLSTLTNPEQFNSLVETILVEYPDHIPLRLIILDKALKSASAPDAVNTDALWRTVIERSDSVIELIDQNELAREFGVNVDKADTKQVTARKEADSRKASLITALSAMASAALALSATTEGSTDGASRIIGSEGGNLLEGSLKMLQKWDDIKAEKHWQFLLARQKRDKLWGLVLKRTEELLTSSMEGGGGGKKGGAKDGVATPSRDELLIERASCFEALGADWAHIAEETGAWARFLKKPGFEPF